MNNTFVYSLFVLASSFLLLGVIKFAKSIIIFKFNITTHHPEGCAGERVYRCYFVEPKKCNRNEPAHLGNFLERGNKY